MRHSVDEHLEIVRRRSDESAFAENRLGNHCGYFFVGDDSLESIFEMSRAVKFARRIFQVVRAAIAIREWDAINLAGKGRETGFVGMGFAGERERHHGAAVEGVFEGDDRRALCVGAGDLDRVLDGFRATVYEQSFLGELAGRDFVHALGEPDVAFVGRDLDAGVEEFVELSMHGIDYGLLAVAGVERIRCRRQNRCSGCRRRLRATRLPLSRHR